MSSTCAFSSADRAETRISLAELFDGIISLPAGADLSVTGIALDSRRVCPGDLFFGCAGSCVHGAQFIDDAITRGAAVVVVEGERDGVDYPRQGVPVISLPGLTHHLGRIAARFYGNPSHQLTVVGVTGTNGKTSVTHLLAQVLNRSEAPCAVIGTVGAGLYGQLAPATHTTPDAVDLQELLADLTAQGARWLAMEVSSHALDQGRVEGVAFDVAVFTNLTRDHLDYHGDMVAYGLAKQRLFQFPGLRYAVVNSDDPFGSALLRELPAGVQAIGYGLSPMDEVGEHCLQVLGSGLCLSAAGLRMTVTTPWGNGVLESSLVGRFNAANLLAVLATLGALGMPLDEALSALARVRSVAGRMEAFGGGPAAPLVVVDYAHTPDALEQVLLTLREHTTGRLWCVFGCGGERDRGKRPLMGAVVERLADVAIVTNDNPRSEEPTDIFRAILDGIQTPEQVTVIPERAAALRYAITSAKSGDVVLVAGKGHEDYQQIGAIRLPFNDRAEVEQLIAIRN
ncbi:UDP-N-acetylmuramoyl-L-alanyl-D-glutamate--2, 6-diaminopimelate ligase [Gammaproteobacteria bacterium]